VVVRLGEKCQAFATILHLLNLDLTLATIKSRLEETTPPNTHNVIKHDKTTSFILYQRTTCVREIIL
jgi:hypothetical protein